MKRKKLKKLLEDGMSFLDLLRIYNINSNKIGQHEIERIRSIVYDTILADYEEQYGQYNAYLLISSGLEPCNPSTVKDRIKHYYRQYITEMRYIVNNGGNNYTEYIITIDNNDNVVFTKATRPIDFAKDNSCGNCHNTIYLEETICPNCKQAIDL